MPQMSRTCPNYQPVGSTYCIKEKCQVLEREHPIIFPNDSAVLKELGTLSENTVWNWERSVMLGGIFHQFPLEIGTPVSITAGVTGILGFANNITRTKAEASYSQENSLRLQYVVLF